MEIQIPYSIFFTFLCFFLFIILTLSASKRSIKNLPPGPWKLPLIGNLHQIGSLPHRSLRNLANKYGPLMHLQLGQMPYIVVSSPEMAKEVTKTHDIIFANRPKLVAGETFAYNSTDVVFSPYGNHWRRLRKICTLELLSIKKVRAFRRIREEEVSAFVKQISEHDLGSVVNLPKRLLPLTISIVARAAFGRKTRNVEKMLSAMVYVMQLASGFSIFDLYPSLEFVRVISGMKAKAEKVRKDIDEILNTIINDHLEKKSGLMEEVEEDLVDVLLKVQKEDDPETPVAGDIIKAVILDMFTAGTETTATTIEWAMAEMVKNPKVMKKAQEEVRRVYGNKGHVDESKLHELNYLTTIIRETLRLHPPGVLLAPRENSETCEINGYVIPLKTKVIINALAIGRHPQYWKEPEIFKPERFIDSFLDYRGANFEYIPFGAGRRICHGISFAAPVLELIIANLLYHFDWKIPKGKRNEELDMTETFLSSVRKKNGLRFLVSESEMLGPKKK